jgi:hypothetical protein
MKKALFPIALVTLFTFTLTAQQIGISAEVRPRFENKHGYKTLLNTNEEGSNFISQRTRLNFLFAQDNLKMGVSFQNVRVWGDVSTLSANDKANSLHEAWAQYAVNDQFSLKFGRQEIVYDDSRIFGNVGWAQQARSHDAVLAKFTFKNKSVLDLGFALNSDSQSGADILYSNAAGYKTFQYAWYHTQMKNFGLSLLALNTGVEFLETVTEQKVNYSQTVGGRATYKNGSFNIDASSYFQSGKLKENSIAAMYFGGNVKYKASKQFSLGLGGEYLSGKDSNDASSKVKSFNPIFGTNHKFNGWMDYFYVGNHLGNVGLVDLHATIAYSKDKFSAKLVPHIFSSAADIYNGTTKMNASLGTEIDFTIGYKISKNIKFNAGYSKMYGTASLEHLKGGDRTENNSWAWMMFTFKPTLFTSAAR